MKKDSICVYEEVCATALFGEEEEDEFGDDDVEEDDG